MSMRLFLRRHIRDVIAIIGLGVIACGVGLYILQHQRLRIPLLEAKPFELKAEFPTAQAVVPGQGQTIRVSGVRIGDIGGTELKNGRAIIKMDIDEEFKDLVHTDASAFLRPKTGLKDMFVELNPGTKSAPRAEEGWTIPIHSTLPDVNPDEFLSALDTDTRDYLRLLINGAGTGLRGRGEDLRDVLKRFEPTYRDLAAVSTEVAKRRAELRRLIHSLAQLNGELANGDDDLAELVQVSSKVFEALASEKANVSATIHELPGALTQLRTSLGQVESMATVLRPTADKLRPVARQLQRTNELVAPFAREAAPIVRDKVRPFVRQARPLVRRLKPAATDLVKSEPGLTRSFTVLNHLFNLLGHNPNGREAPEKTGRNEGFLFYLSWLGHQSNSIFSSQDAHGPMRALTLGGTCATLRGTLQYQPQLEMVLGLTGLLTDPNICGGQALTQKEIRSQSKVGGVK
jgi:phospholipid/cholesterol/gamma-HCH transport system substrate-binding protein